MAEFGELLVELRQERKMTQRTLADFLNVTTGTISNYENGVYYPDVRKLIALADLFRVSTDYLLGRCRHNLSPDVFNEATIDRKTVGELISEIQRLPTDRKDVLAVILSDMNFRMAVKGYNEKEHQ